MSKEELLSRITADPEVLVGKPIIRGTRLSVELILGLLGEGMTISEIMQEYPRIQKDDILACILFARDLLQDIKYSPIHR